LNSVATSQAGSYTVVVTNSAGSVTSAPAVLTVTQLPNLTPSKLTGWSDTLVLATNSTGIPQDAGIIYSNQDVYVSWGFLNPNTNGAISVRFYYQLYLDGVANHAWYSDGLSNGFIAYVSNYNIGKLALGAHTLRIDADSTSVVPESNEADN